jgi:adenosylhomocysteine nucleosidase
MSNSPSTLVCFAVKEEARYFARRVDSHPEIRILLTGMGRLNVERTVRPALVAHAPQRVITAGFAGGLRPELKTGTVVFFADPETGLESHLRASGATQVHFYNAETVISTAVEKQALFRTTGAEAVEMESQYVQALCREAQVPAATVRVILDTAAEDLPLDFNQVMTPDQRMDYGKLAFHLLRSPSKIKVLLRLQKQSTFAARRLAEILAPVLGC